MPKYSIYTDDAGYKFFSLTKEHKEFLSNIVPQRHFMTDEAAFDIVDNLRDNNGSRILMNAFEGMETLQALRNAVVLFYEGRFESHEEKRSDEAYDEFTRQSMVVHVIDMAMYNRKVLVEICKEVILKKESK